MRLWLSEVAQLFGYPWRAENLVCTGVSTDSRSTRRGDIFIALSGQNFDGHDFIEQAFSRGAVAAIISAKSARFPFIKVDNTLKALAVLAKYWHRKCQTNGKDGKKANQTIGITGSVGKTTVKEMLATMLANEVPICVTKGNFNNAIGLPLTLLHEKPEDAVAVIELGANAKHEISALCDIAQPDIGVITSIAEAHLCGFEDLQGIAQAKSELFQSLSAEGTAIVNFETPYLSLLLEHAAHCKTIIVSQKFVKEADVWAENINTLKQALSFDYCSRTYHFNVTLSLMGLHNISNALLAITAVFALGFNAEKLAANLSAMESIKGRLVKHVTKSGQLIIDDTYNANPTSVKAAIDFLSIFAGRKILVLGDMGELGENEKAHHTLCGQYAKNARIDAIYSVGDLAKEATKAFDITTFENHTFNNKTEIVTNLACEIKNKSTILVKGSRAARMEQVVVALCRLSDNLQENNKNNKNINEEYI